MPVYVEKIRTVDKIVKQEVFVDRIREVVKRVEVPVDRIVIKEIEKRVEVPVSQPVKVVEIFVDKYIDRSPDVKIV